MFCIEALDLVNAGPCVLREIEDVHLAMTEDQPHADRCVATRCEGAVCAYFE